MLDRDGRAEAALELRAWGEERVQRSHSDDNITAQDRLCELAAALEAEPEGYDYETAAVERGEVLRDLLLAIAEMSQHPQADVRGAEVLERARIVLEGVERTHALVPLGPLRDVAHMVERLAHDYNAPDAQPWPINADEAFALSKACGAAARGERVEWPA